MQHFPLRHVDRTVINNISEINPEMEYAQVAGVLLHFEVLGQKAGRRLVAQVSDKSGILELTWFQGISWIQKFLQPGHSYLIYGRVSFYQSKPQIIHPEMEPLASANADGKSTLEPIYPSTEKLKARGLGGKQLSKLVESLFNLIKEKDLQENLPAPIIVQLKLTGRFNAYRQIHFPQNNIEYENAVKRLKFEEFFIAQLRMNLVRMKRHQASAGVIFDKVGDLFNTFYKRLSSI